MIKITIKERNGVSGDARNLYFFDFNQLKDYIGRFGPEGRSDLELAKLPKEELVDFLQDFFNAGFYYPKYDIGYSEGVPDSVSTYYAKSGLPEEVAE